MRRWFQFRLRTLLILMTVGCVWIGREAQLAREQNEAVQQINALGGSVGDDGFSFQGKPYQWPGRASVAALLGRYYVYNVVSVYFRPDRETLKRKKSPSPQSSGPRRHTDGPAVCNEGLAVLAHVPRLTHLELGCTDISDAGLRHLSALRKLRSLVLCETLVTDAGLEYLKGLRKLKNLDLSYTAVTDAGVADLQKHLPNCKIERRVPWWNEKILVHIIR
jgi:hypothetical protein